MKKKMAALVLAMVIVGMTAGCGNKADDSKEKEGTKTEADNAEDSETEQEFVLTNKDGKVVTIDEKDMTKYITLGAYKNLEIEAPAKAVVTDENVNTFIMQQIVAKPEEQIEVTEDRAIQKYDTANIDYAGYKDGVAFDGGTAEGADLNIGFGGFIDGFEDGLIGHKKGEEVTLDLTFPEDYGNTELAGQAVQFKVKINKISEPPKLTDEWAAANTDYKTVEEYKKGQREFLEKDAQNAYDIQVKGLLFEKLVEESEITDYPEKELKETVNGVRQQLENMYMAQLGKSFDDVLKEQNITKEEADKQIEDIAKASMAQNMVVQAVLNAEGIEVKENEYNTEKEKYALINGFPSVEVLDMYMDQKTIKDNVLWNRVCEVLLETAKVTEK